MPFISFNNFSSAGVGLFPISDCKSLSLLLNMFVSFYVLQLFVYYIALICLLSLSYNSPISFDLKIPQKQFYSSLIFSLIILLRPCGSCASYIVLHANTCQDVTHWYE